MLYHNLLACRTNLLRCRIFSLYYISSALKSFNPIDYILQSPVLLPTVSDEPRTDFESVKDYFDAFLLKKPQGKILDGKITIGDGWASDSGIYEVRLIILFEMQDVFIQNDMYHFCSYDINYLCSHVCT